MATSSRLGPQSNTKSGVVVYDNPVDDKRTPDSPTALDGSASLGFSLQGGYTATVTLTWTIPTTATDGTPMAPSTIEVWARNGTTGAFARTATADGTDTSVMLHGYAAGDTWQFKIRAVSTAGKASAYSATVTVTMPVDDDPPPMASIPTLSTRLGAVNITWDGLATGGAAMPDDLDHVTVQRATNDTFTAGVTNISTLGFGGIAVDAPLDVSDTFFYRLISVDRAGNEGPASSSASITVEGVTGPDIPDELIDASKLDSDLNDSIQTAIDDAAAAQAAVVGVGKIYLQSTEPTGANEGALWFDTSDDNRPKRFDGTDWVNVRDALLDAAFAGDTLGSDYIAADLVQAKFIAAGLVDATTIIASGTITADSGIIGSLDAGVIDTGFLSADRIAAQSITATKLVLGDTENLVDEPLFDDSGASWSGTGTAVSISDHPVSGVGHAWQVTGNGTALNATNARAVPVAPTDQFHGEVWVRKTASGTTGTVSLLLTVKRSGTTDTTVTLDTNTFATGGAGAWVQLVGNATIPALGYQVSAVLQVASSVASGDIQFASPAVRRKGTAALIVDGSITATQLAASSVTATQLAANSVTTAKIAAGAVTATQIAANAITANAINAGAVTAAKIAANTITTDQLAAGAVTTVNIATDSITSAKMQANSIGTSELQAGSVTADQIAANTITSNQIAANTITANRIAANAITSSELAAGAVTADTIAANAVTAAKIAATAIDGMTITGATIRTGVSPNARIVMDSDSFGMWNSGNVQLISITSDHFFLHTQAAGHRISLTDTALNLFDSDGTNTVSLDGLTGSATFTGPIVTGGTITGSTVRTNSGNPRIELTSSRFSVFDSSGFETVGLAVGSGGGFVLASAASGARMLLNNNGLAIFDSSGTRTVYLQSTGDATFSGTVTASSFTSTNTLSGTISGGTLSGNTHSGGSISGTLTNGGILSGGTIRTSSGANRVQLVGDQIQIFSNGSLGAVIAGDGSAVACNIKGNGSGGSVFLGDADQVQVTNTGHVFSTAIGSDTAASSDFVVVTTTGLLAVGTSSQRYKTAIADLDLDPAFLSIDPITWLDRPSFASVTDWVASPAGRNHTGFLAENLDRVGLRDAVGYDRMRRPNTIRLPAILAHNVKYTQWLVDQVNALTARVTALEGAST